MKSPKIMFSGVGSFNDLLQRTDSYGYPFIFWTSNKGISWEISSAEELETKLGKLSITMVRRLVDGKTVFHLQHMSSLLRKKARRSGKSNIIKAPSWWRRALDPVVFKRGQGAI